MNHKVAILWDEEVDVNGEYPAKQKWRNKDLRLYTEIARDNQIELYNASFSQYSDGEIRKAWHWNGDKWVLAEDVSVSLVYDKFKYDEETKDIKELIDTEKEILNSLKLERICMDKYKTHQMFPNRVPETAKAKKQEAERMLEKYDEIVLKPRYGYGGRGISKTDNLSDIESVDEEEYIIQKLVTTEGMPSFDVEGYHDLRIVLINDEMVNAYIREPAEGFRSNVDQGGSLNYVDISSVPHEVKEIVREVDRKIEVDKPRLYSVDFMINDNQEPKIMELNSKPAVYCFKPVKQAEIEKPLIEELFKQMKHYLDEF